MGKIIERLQKTMDAMSNATTNPGLGDKLADAAIKAMMGGRESTDFKSYMALFADNKEQLARLTAPIKDTDPSWLAQSRAYIIANAICGGDSTTQTGKHVEPDIDKDISAAVDGNIVLAPAQAPADGAQRPFEIPAVPQG